MKHTIDLSESGEERLQRIVRSTGHDEDALLGAFAEGILVADASEAPRGEHDLALSIGSRTLYIDLGTHLYPIRSTQAVMGGDACIRNTRIPVWMLVGYKQAQFSDERILANFPDLSAADLTAAWDYYAANTDGVLEERARHAEAD